MRVFVVIALVSGITGALPLLTSKPAQAASAKTLNFQARLLGSQGNIVPDGYYNIEFKLYNAASGGSALWTDTYYDSNGASAGNDARIQVKAGYVSVYLGDQAGNPLPSNIWGQQLWLTMNVGGTTQTATPTWDGEMNPRLKLTAVPAAYSLTNFNGATNFSSTLTLAGATGGDQNFVVPDQGAAGTYNLLTQNAANAGYIQNQSGSDQTADFRISGTGRANTALQAPLLDTATATALAIGTTNATVINLNQNTTIASAKNLTVTAGATSLTGAAAGNQNALYVNTGATTNKGLVIQGVASQTANYFEVQNSAGTIINSIDTQGYFRGTGLAAVASGRSYINTGQLNNAVKVGTNNAANVGLYVEGSAAQSADLLRLQDVSGNINASFNSSGNQLTLGRIASSGTVTQGRLIFSDGTTSNFGTTLQSATLTTGNQTITIPDTAGAGGTICLQNSTACGFAPATGANYLAKNANDTSTASYLGNLLALSNTNSGAAGVLGLTNAGTNSALTITQSGNPTAGQALIYANNSNGTPSGNLIDLRSSGTSRLTVDVSGNANLTGVLSVAGITNSGATLNTAQSLANFGSSQNIGSAASTVDIYSTFTINQTTSAITLALPTPTVATAGRLIYVANIGTQAFTMHDVSVQSGKAQMYIWNGSAWTATNIDGAGSGVTFVGGLIDVGTKSSNGAAVSGNGLYLQTADATYPGLVSVTTQTFAGDKTFAGSVTTSATGGTALAVTGAPTNSATSSLIRIGGAIAGGNTAANGGTYIGLNAPASGAGSAADFINFQSNGTSRFTVTSAGALTAVGVNSGTGLIQGTGGLTLTGTTQINATTGGTTTIGSASAGAISLQSGGAIGIGSTSTTALTLGNSTATFQLDSNTIDISTAGVISGVTGFTMASGNFLQNGTGTFTTGTGTVSLNGDTDIAANKALSTKVGTTYTTPGAAANDVNLGGGSFYVLDTSGAAQSFTSFAAGRDGQRLTLLNNDATNAVTLNNNGTGTNKIITGTGSAITIPVGGTVDLIFDSANTRWRVVGTSAVTGGFANQQLSNLSGTIAVNASLTPGNNNTLDVGSSANSWRTIYADTSVLTPTVDTDGAANLNIGTATQNQLTLGRSGAATLINGSATSAITFTNFSVNAAGNIVGVGVNSGTGLIQGTGGLTLTGTTQINATTGGTTTIGSASAGAISLQSGGAIGIGSTSTTALTLGNSTATFQLDSNTVDISTAGVISGVTGFTMASGNFLQNGTGTFTTGTGLVSLNGNTDIANNVSFATKVGATFTAAGTSTSAALNGASYYVMDTSGAAQVIQGITAGRDGQRLTLTNIDALAVTLANDNVSATGSRIITGTNGDITIPQGASVELIYDSANTRWRVVGSSSVTGGFANQQLSNLSGTIAINASLTPNATNTLDVGSSANSWRTIYADTSVLTPTIDTDGAANLNIGTSAQNQLTLGRSGAATIINGNTSSSISMGNFTVSSAGAIVGVGVNSGTGLIQGTGGATITGALLLNTTGSGNTQIGNATGTFQLDSNTVDISTAGVISGVTGFTMASGNFLQNGTGTFTTGTGTVSLNGDTDIAANKAFSTKVGTTYTTPGAAADDVNLGGGSFYILDTSGAAQSFTSFAAGRDGQRLTLVNNDATNVVTLNNNGTGTNKIITGTGSAITIPVGGSVELIFDSANTRWRVTGAAAVTGGFANQQLSNLSGTVAVNASLTTGTTNTIDLGSSTNAWRSLYANTSVLTPAVDTATATTMTIGTATQTGLTIGRVGASTAINGNASSTITFTNFSVNAAGAVTAVGVNSGTGLIQGTGGLTVVGTTQINASGTSATTIGNATAGAFTIQGNAASSISTATGNLSLDAAAAVNIGTTNATSVSISRSGQATTVNGTLAATGAFSANAGATVRGSLTVNTATATDDQLLMSVTAGGAARFNGTFTNLDLTANRTYTLQDNTGIIPLSTAGNNLFFTTSGATTLTLPTSGTVTVNPSSGNYLQSVPGATATNTISPTAASVTGLTVNGTSNATGATALIVNQSNASASGAAVNLTNTTGTQTDGLLINRNGAGGTTTNLLNLTNTAGTATNALNFSGTFTNLINSTNFSVSNAGNITTNGTINTNTFTGTSLTFAGANPTISASTSNTGLTVQANGSGTLLLNTTGAGTVNLGTANTTTVAVGNTAAAVSILGGSNVTLASSNGTNSTTVRFTGTQTAGNIFYELDRTVSAGTYTICTTANSCGLSGGNYYLQQIPSSNTAANPGANVISPTAASITGMTINGTTNATGATALIVNQSNATATGAAINLTNTTGTQTNGLLINRNTAGGTTTNGLNITNTAGTLTNGLSFTGTIGTDIYRGSGILTVAGADGLSLSSSGASGDTGSVFVQSGNSTSGVAGNISIDNGTSIYNSGTTVVTKTFEGCSNNSMFSWYGTSSVTGNNPGAGIARTGSCVLRVVEQGGNGGFWAIEHDTGSPFTLTAGTVYTVSAWVRMAAGTQVIDGSINTNLNTNFYLSTVTAVSGSWTQMTGTFVAPPGTTNGVIRFGSDAGSGASTIYFDDVTIVSGAAAPAINIGTSNAQTINIGNANTQGAVTLQSGSGGIVLNGGATGTILIGSNNGTGSITLGSSTGTQSVLVANGAGASTVNIANTTTAGATVNIATAAGVNTVSIGSTNSTSTTTLSAGSGNLNFNASQAQFTQVTGTRTLTVQTRTTNVAGSNLTVAAGAAGTGASAFSGGTLTLQGGAAAGTGNANGGGVAISGGAGTGTGVLGLVSLAPTTFLVSGATQVFGSDGSVTGVDTASTIPISASTTNITVTIPAPNAANQVVGRILYVSNVGATNDVTISLAGTSITIVLKPNSTATLIWNGNGWTAAGASSSTDLQAAYNNTASTAGAAELVLRNTASADGLTVRNGTGANEIIGGGLLEVQTSIGSNLFTVNNNAVEYATNGGAETQGGSNTTFPSNTWDATTGGTVTRHPTAGNYIATGQASVSVATSAQNHGARNRLSTTLSSGLSYTVSFAVRGTTNFSNLEVRYSPDGTTTGTTQCNPGSTNVTYTVTSGQWTRISCSFVASGTITSANSMLIRFIGTSNFPTYYIDNLSVTVNASSNFAGDGTADNVGSFATNWGDYEAGTAVAVAQETSVIYEGSASARAIITPATANVGIRNNMGITPAINTQFLVSFYVRSTTLMTGSLAVGFLPAGGTGLPSGSAACVDYNTQTVQANVWTKVTCLLTTPGAGISNPDLVIYQTDSAARTIYVDALSITLNSNNSSNVQVGGANKGGPATLFTLDRSSTAPIAANNDAYLGSMYYDTVTGRIQCYEADGWGACGAAPDTSVVLTPEYTGAVLNGTGVGTMTADFCANQSGTLQVNTSFCASGLSRNYYKWTSPQASQQVYSVYVSYKLPSTFKAFNDDSTISLTALTSDTANGAVTYEVFRSTGSAVSRCYDGVTNETTVTTTNNTWQTVGINGNEATGCSFSSGDNVIFKINVKAQNNANVYVENLTFTYTNK